MPARHIPQLKRDLVALGEMCEHALDTALMALIDRDPDLAFRVLATDVEIDERELELDRRCRDLLSTGRLKPAELRFVLAASKITNDLERIGDAAVHVVQSALFLVREQTLLAQVVDFGVLVELASQMIREAVSAVIESDTKLAWTVIDLKEKVEDEMQVIFRQLLDLMRSEPRSVERCCYVLFAAQDFRRAAELAFHIAEEVVFLEEGKVVRHHLKENHPVAPAPFGAGSGKDSVKAEAALLKRALSRATAKKQTAEAKRKTRVITTEQAADAIAVDKRVAARDKLLRLHNRGGNKSGGKK